MKKYIYTAMLIMTGLISVNAQRMLAGQKGLELNIGALSGKNLSDNYYLNAGVTVYAKNGNYFLGSFEYGRQQISYKKMNPVWQTYLVEGGYNFQLLRDAGSIFTLNAGLSAVAGYESGKLNASASTKSIKYNPSEENFIFGPGARISVETYVSDHLVLLLAGKAKFLWGTPADKLRPSIGLGLRYNF